MSNIILSQDGSHTIASERFGVSYHSKYGAIQETETVFLSAGLQYKLTEGKDPINILEMGFGTGLNALMTMTYPDLGNTKVKYHTIEAYPISISSAKELNYPTVLNLSAEQTAAFINMHELDSEKTEMLTPNFQFTKHITLLEDFTSQTKFDVIYYDAFAPSAQEELW